MIAGWWIGWMALIAVGQAGDVLGPLGTPSDPPAYFRSPSSASSEDLRTPPGWDILNFENGCQSFRARGTDSFRDAMIYLKHRLILSGMEPYAFPAVFAQLANESGFGTSYASLMHFNLGAWFVVGEGSGYRRFESLRQFVDVFIEYVQGPTYGGKCLDGQPDSLTPFAKSQGYIRCLLSGASTWRACVTNHSRSGGNCYCASRCSDIYNLPIYSHESSIPDFGRGYGTWKNMQIGRALLEDSYDCLIPSPVPPDSASVSLADPPVPYEGMPRAVNATQEPGPASSGPRQLTALEIQMKQLSGCAANVLLPPVGKSCHHPGQRRVYCEDRYACYCQYNLQRRLNWNCFEIKPRP